MSEENGNVETPVQEMQVPAVAQEKPAAEGAVPEASAGNSLQNAPVPTNLGVAVITVIYILFVLGVGIGLIALSIFLFRKLGSWIF